MATIQKQEDSKPEKIEITPSSDYYNKQFEAQMSFYKKHWWILIIIVPFFLFVIYNIINGFIRFNSYSNPIQFYQQNP